MKAIFAVMNTTRAVVEIIRKIRPYFHYCLSSVHHCEDRFHSRFYPQFTYMIFIYSQSFKLKMA